MRRRCGLSLEAIQRNKADLEKQIRQNMARSEEEKREAEARREEQRRLLAQHKEHQEELKECSRKKLLVKKTKKQTNKKRGESSLHIKLT